MDELSYAISAVVGYGLTWVTQLAKKWPFLEQPLAKFVFVIVLSGIAGIGFSWLYVEPFCAKAAFKSSATMAIVAMLGNTTRKQIKNGKN